jgi:predicted HTH transcriptional regulator
MRMAVRYCSAWKTTAPSAVYSTPTPKEKTWFYPKDAVREAVINALAHRDWSRRIDIMIANYSDRLEINSPGSFLTL